MTRERISEILKENKINEIYYNAKSIWIQETKNNIATIGFLDSNETKNVFIEDLYE